jgi:CDP-6-deoxy-D-xylo-4-hexulose-3-dehydrase
MEKSDVRIGDIILVKDSPIGDLLDKLLLVLDVKGTDLLCTFIDNGNLGVEITDDDLEEGKLNHKKMVTMEKLFTISPVDCQKVASLKKDSLDKILRTLTKYASSIYFRVFHEGKSLNKIPASGKVLDEDDLFNLIDASLDMWLTAGRFAEVEEFEKEFPKFLGRKYCALVNSGSSANLIAISALTSYKLGDGRLKLGDEVITVAAGFPTTITPIIQNNLTPVFVDVDLETYNINIEQLEMAISEKTKAIFLAHTLGNPFDVDKVIEIAKKHDLWVIEDNCDALGSKYKGRFTGTFGDISTVSFYPAHHMTMGEGGAILTDNPELYKIILSFRDWGRDCWCPPGKDNTCGKRFSWKLGDLPYGYDHKYIFTFRL